MAREPIDPQDRRPDVDPSIEKGTAAISEAQNVPEEPLEKPSSSVTTLRPFSKVSFENPQNTPSLLEFREDKNVVLTHDFRVYIQGVDVTAWVTENISITYTNRDGFNTASFALDNVMDRFVLTEENLGLRKRTEAAQQVADVAQNINTLVDKQTQSSVELARKALAENVPLEHTHPSERETGAQLEPPNFRITSPDSADWRYSENAKFEVFLYKSGISKNIVRQRRAIVQDRFFQIYATLPGGGVSSADSPSVIEQHATEVVIRVIQELTSATRNNQSIYNEAGKLTPYGIDLKETLISEVQSTYGLSKSVSTKIVTDVISSRIKGDQRITAATPGLDPTTRNAIIARRDRQLRALNARGKIRSIFDKDEGTLQIDTVSQIKAYVRGRNSNRNPTDFATGDRVWPLGPKSVIFHKNDPIRIFVKNPHTENDEWVYAYTGFVDEANVSTDHITGSSKLNISCYDIRSLMQKMRISFSVHDGKTAQKEPLFEDPANFFNDLLIPSRYGHAFSRTSLESTAIILITGATLGKNSNILETTRVAGVGQYRVGNIVSYPANINNTDPNSPENRKILELWHAQGFTNKPDASFLTLEDVNRVGQGTITDGDFSPDKSNLHILLPPEGTGIRQLTERTFQDGTDTRDWVDRYTVLTDFLSKIDYEWLVLPSGDISIEFPMYDFLPEDYGSFSTMMSANYHITNDTFADESGDVVTSLVATGSPSVQEETGTPANFTPEAGILDLTGLLPKAIVTCNNMIARVGMRVDTLSLPFMTDPYRLSALALVEFQKRLSMASQMSVDFVYRPFLLPNRPFFNADAKRIGTASAVTQNIQIFNTATSNLSLKYIRTMREDGTFRHLTGGAGCPIGYRNVTNEDSLESFVESFAINTKNTGVRLISSVNNSGRAKEPVKDTATKEATPKEAPTKPADPVDPAPSVPKQRVKKSRKGRFLTRLTHYWVTQESDFSNNSQIPIFDRNGNEIYQTNVRFFQSASLQGRGITNTDQLLKINPGTWLTVDHDRWQHVVPILKSFKLKSGFSATYSADGRRLTQLMVRPFSLNRRTGVGGFGRTPGKGDAGILDPYRTIAADLGQKKLVLGEPLFRGKGGLFPRGTKIYIPSFKGKISPFDGSTLDGIFTVTDAGQAIYGAHFDVFVGVKTMASILNPDGIVEFEILSKEALGRWKESEQRVGGLYGWGIIKPKGIEGIKNVRAFLQRNQRRGPLSDD